MEDDLKVVNEKFIQMQGELLQLQADMIKDRNKTNRLPWVICAIVVLVVCATFVSVHFRTLSFFSEYEFYSEEVTVNQDTNEGSGNNVYLPGENSKYFESGEEVE